MSRFEGAVAHLGVDDPVAFGRIRKPAQGGEILPLQRFSGKLVSQLALMTENRMNLVHHHVDIDGMGVVILAVADSRLRYEVLGERLVAVRLHKLKSTIGTFAADGAALYWVTLSKPKGLAMRFIGKEVTFLL